MLGLNLIIVQMKNGKVGFNHHITNKDRLLIASELVELDDSIINRIIKSSDSPLIQPIQNKAISSLLQLRQLDQEPFKVIKNKLNESPTYSEIIAGQRKFKQLGNVDITDEELYKVSRVLVGAACGVSSLKLALIGEKISVVDELTKSLVDEYAALSIDIDTKNAEKLLQESQRLLNSLY